jgi:hypothetical protein
VLIFILFAGMALRMSPSSQAKLASNPHLGDLKTSNFRCSRVAVQINLVLSKSLHFLGEIKESRLFIRRL